MLKIHVVYDRIRMVSGSRLRKWFYRAGNIIYNILYPLFGNKKGYGLDAQSKVIVSLTTYPARIKTVWITVNSLLNQSVKPYKVILWLAEEQFDKDSLPRNLTRLRERGLEVRFCDDLRSHKKYYYTMKEYTGYHIITADDDMLYPENMIEKLQKLSDCYPDHVCCTLCHFITYTEEERLAEYAKWYNKDSLGIPSFQILPVGCGGVLYPPGVLDERVFDKKLIQTLCMNADDLWLKSMAVLNRKKAVCLKGNPLPYFTVLRVRKTGLHYDNVGKSKNDEAMAGIVGEFPEVQELLYKDYLKG